MVSQKSYICLSGFWWSPIFRVEGLVRLGLLGHLHTWGCLANGHLLTALALHYHVCIEVYNYGMVGQLCTTLSIAHKQQYMCSKHYYIYCKSIAWLASGHFSQRHPSQSESPTTASFFIAMYLKKKMKNKKHPRQRQMLGHFSQRHPSPSESHFILQQLHPSIILYRDASGRKSKTPETKSNCSVSGHFPQTSSVTSELCWLPLFCQRATSKE